MFTYWKQRSEFKRYSETVEHYLRALFSDYPIGTVDRLRLEVDVARLQRVGFEGKDTGADCAVMIARDIVGVIFGELTDVEKVETAAAFDARDLTHPLFYALASMDITTQQIMDDVQRRLLLYEAAGRLKSMTREEIDNWWGREEVARITGAISGEGKSVKS